MDGEVIDHRAHAGGGHLVDVQKLPPDVLSQILRRLNQRSQRSTQIFNEDFHIVPDDIKSLFDRIRQEFGASNCLSESLSVSLYLRSGRRVDFLTWDEFRSYDSAQADRTKSITVTYTRDLLNEVKDFERYRVQISIHNLNGRMPFLIGPISLSRVEDVGVPPVPVFLSVDYTDFIRGKNIVSTVEKWIEGLDKNEKKFLVKLQKHSDKIKQAMINMAVFVSIFACSHFIPDVKGGVAGLYVHISYALMFVFASYVFSKWMSEQAETAIDRQRVPNVISLTRGDIKFDKKLSSDNSAYVKKAGWWTFGLIVQISCSLAASYIWAKWPT